MIRKLLAGAAAAAVLGTAAFAYAANDPVGPSLAAQVEDGSGEEGEARMEPRRHLRRRFAAGEGAHPGHGFRGLRAGIHGDLIVPDGEGGWQEVAFDKGTVVSVDADHLVLRRPDDVTVGVDLTGDTTYKGVEGWDAIQTDRAAIVFSRDGDALAVGQRPESGPPRHSERKSGMVADSEEQVPAT